MDIIHYHYIGAAFALCICVCAAAWGISRIVASSMEAMARQPEIADKVSSSMSTYLAFVEGAAMFGILVCLLIIVLK